MQVLAHSPEFLRKRKFLMVLPLITVPFITVLFYLFGGGKGFVTANSPKIAGLNTALPDAHFAKKHEPDKLALYEAANSDSAKWKSAIKDDPYRNDSSGVLSMSFEHSSALQDILKKAIVNNSEDGIEKLNFSLTNNKSVDHEKDLKDKLSQLQVIVNAKPHLVTPVGSTMIEDKNPDPQQIPKYQKAIASNYTPDPDLVQLDKMLDKIEAIQHPQSVQDSSLNKPKEKIVPISFQTSGGGNAVSAIIPEKQTLVSGTTIRLQLMDSVKLNGSKLEAGQFVYGTAMLSNERLKIQVRSVRVGNNIIPVNLDVYDLDGMEGIFVPGSMSRDVSKQTLDQGLSGMGLANLDPSLGAQAASAGIQAAKTLISRKVKMVEVTIPVGYQVLLKSEQ